MTSKNMTHRYFEILYIPPPPRYHYSTITHSGVGLSPAPVRDDSSSARAPGLARQEINIEKSPCAVDVYRGPEDRLGTSDNGGVITLECPYPEVKE